MFSNLLGNAISHGDASRPIMVRAITHPVSFELSVANAGTKISDETIPYLFHPFYRDKVGASMQGLGLGLYIASEIAKAHGGTIDVSSTDDATRFMFRMPLLPAPPV